MVAVTRISLLKSAWFPEDQQLPQGCPLPSLTVGMGLVLQCPVYPLSVFYSNLHVSPNLHHWQEQQAPTPLLVSRKSSFLPWVLTTLLLCPISTQPSS